MVAEIPGIERIRYTTSHPNEFTQRLIDVYARVPQLVNHLHLPVQHGSDRILSAMKRGYTALQYKSTIRRLRAVRPDISLSTDFIVGFPGETEDDHALTMKLIDDIGFDSSFSFIFSARPGTPAAALHDDTPQALKLQRLQQLQARIEANARRIGASRVGTVQRILVEGRVTQVQRRGARADGPHRVQPHRQLRRAAVAGRPADRRGHHRGLPALAARPLACSAGRPAHHSASAEAATIAP